MRFFYILLFWPPLIFGQSILTFSDHGKLVKKVSLSQLKKSIPIKSLKVIEPHMGTERIYKGFDSKELLTFIYGNIWKTSEEILFTCADGYQPSVPVVDLKNNESFLTFELSGSKEFIIENKFQNEKRVELGPFYLIWNNIKNPELKTDTYSWPYQVVAIDLIDFKTKFSQIIPPANSKPSVTKGFLSYRKYCMTCHGMNGEGGKKARDLNLPENVSLQFTDEYLAKWIDNPQKIKRETTMPALFAEIKNRQEVILNIIAYIKAMKK